MKKLISIRDIEDMKKLHQTVCHMDENTIVTPSAREEADASGIQLVVTDGEVQEFEIPDLPIDSTKLYRVLKLLMENGLLKDIFKPYEEKRHSKGLKVIKGSTVSMDVFDTGKAGTSVYYQELVNQEEAQISAGLLVIDHSDFDRESSCEEVAYVIEGTLLITIDEETFPAHAGDVLFVPSGSKVNWCSPDKARLFYATYPANWPEMAKTIKNER